MNFARILSNSKQLWAKGIESYQPSRRKLLVGGSILAGAALAGSTQAVQAHGYEFLTFDVACDGRTLKFIRMDPNATDQWVTRGDAFIVNGKIYPGGTIEQGLTGPDQPGSLGTWVCRGWIYVDDLTDPEQVPHAATTQHYLLDDGNGLASDGLEGGIKTRRAIVGGMGHWADTKGNVTQEQIGENDTILELGGAQVPAPNFRFVFSLTSRH